MGHADGDDVGVVQKTTEERGIIEVLGLRAHLLTGQDRALLEVYLDRGSSFRQIGRLMGLDSRNVGRRVQGIVRRLLDDTYPTCLRHRDDFTRHELGVIKDHFVGGLSERETGRKHAIPRYRVRSILQKARRYAGCVKERSAG